MPAALCAGAIVLGILVGRRFSFLALLLASPVVWTVCALALSTAGRSPGQACLVALAPVLAVQIAFFAGAQTRVEAASVEDSPRVERAPARCPLAADLGPLGANEREGKA